MPETLSDNGESIEDIWRQTAGEMLDAPDSETFFQARQNYLLCVFIITGTTSLNAIKTDDLNDVYSRGLEQAYSQRSLELPVTLSFDRDTWRRTFTTTLAGIHKPDRQPLASSLSDMLFKLKNDPKHYYHEH